MEGNSLENRLRAAGNVAVGEIMHAQGMNAVDARSALVSHVARAQAAYKAQAAPGFGVQLPPGTPENLRRAITSGNARLNSLSRDVRISNTVLALTGGGMSGSETGVSKSTAEAIAALIAESLG